MLFKDLNLPDFIVRALDKHEISVATEIQEKAIPAILNKNDVIGQSRTGSGKTFAYGIPSILGIDSNDSVVQALIVCPTRELTMQICDELRKLTLYKEGIKIVPVYGGSNMERQIVAIKHGAKIVVGTPGRLLDHIKRKTLKLKNLKTLVLDEADEMLDMGFKTDIENIIEQTNPYRQTIMFSATMPKPILDITKNYMKNPILIKVKDDEKNKQIIKQYFSYVDRKKKYEAIKDLYSELNPTLSIIFCNTKKMVDELVLKMNKDNLIALGLHGDMRQSERKRVMTKIKNRECNILIATDVAARGIDINNVDIVFNYDLPIDDEYYIHRIGRTGRAGKLGKAYSIITSKNQITQMQNLGKMQNVKVEEFIIESSLNKEKIDLENFVSDKKFVKNTKNYQKIDKKCEKTSKNRKFSEKNKIFNNKNNKHENKSVGNKNIKFNKNNTKDKKLNSIKNDKPNNKFNKNKKRKFSK